MRTSQQENSYNLNMKQLKKEWTKLMTGETQCNDFTKQEVTE